MVSEQDEVTEVEKMLKSRGAARLMWTRSRQATVFGSALCTTNITANSVICALQGMNSTSMSCTS
jgi:hypothetical protein